MKPVKLGFKAFDPHELLCHFLAVEGNHYDDAELQVELVDITFTPDDKLPPDLFQASCGAAMLAGLKGIPQRIVFVGVDRPMFWLYARVGIGEVGELRQGKVVTFPSIAPPWHFTRLLLNQHALDPDSDVQLLSARDDTARLGLLRSGHVDAAIISSSVAPAHVESLGFSRLACLGDAIRTPTTGLATHTSLIQNDPDTVSAMVTAHHHGLRQLRENSASVRKVLEDVFDVEPELVDQTIELYRACFTQNGREEPDDIRAAIAQMVQILELSDIPAWEEIYDSSFI